MNFFLKRAKAALLPCPRAVHLSVLHKLHGAFPDYNYLSVWVSANYDPAYWNPKLEYAQSEINRIRDWANTLDDLCVRREYSGWLDYYQRNLDSAYRELRTHDEQHNMAAYGKRLEAERAEVSAHEDKFHIPAPPKLSPQSGKESK